MHKKILLAGLVIITVSLGFLRDHVFLAINQSLAARSAEAEKLLMFKWGLTALFCLMYLVNTCLLQFILFRSFKYVRFAVLAYAVLFAVSLAAFAARLLLPDPQGIYLLVRAILGVAQSPIPMMVLIPASLLNEAMSEANGKKD